MTIESFYGYSWEQEHVPTMPQNPTDKIIVTFERDNNGEYLVSMVDVEKSAEPVKLKKVGAATMQVTVGSWFTNQLKISWVMWRIEYIDFLHKFILAIR